MHLEFTGTKTEFDTFRADLARTGYLIGESATRDGCDCLAFTRHGLHFHAQLAVLAPERPAGTWSIDGLRDRVAAALAAEFDRQWPNHDLRGIEWRSIAAAGLAEMTGWGAAAAPDAGHVRVPLTGAELVEDIANRIAQASGMRVEVVDPPCRQHLPHPHGGLVCAQCPTCRAEQPGAQYAAHDFSDVLPASAAQGVADAVAKLPAGDTPMTDDDLDDFAGQLAAATGVRVEVHHAGQHAVREPLAAALMAMAQGPSGRYVVFETSDQRRLTLTQDEYDALLAVGVDPATRTRDEVLAALERTGS